MVVGRRAATALGVGLAVLGVAACGGGGSSSTTTAAEATADAEPTGPAPTSAPDTTAAPATSAPADPSTLPLDDPATLEVGTASVELGQFGWSYVGTDGEVAAEEVAAWTGCGGKGRRVDAGPATLRVPLPATSIRAFENPAASSAEQVQLGSADGPELTFELPPRRIDLAVAAFGEGFSDNYRVCLDARPAQAPTETASPASTER